MDNPTFLAYLAIGIAVFAYPLELLWKKLFSVTSDYYKEMLHTFFKYGRYTFALLGLLVAYFKMDFNKQFVMFVALTTVVLILSLVVDLIYSFRQKLDSEHLKVTQRQFYIEERLDNLADNKIPSSNL